MPSVIVLTTNASISSTRSFGFEPEHQREVQQDGSQGDRGDRQTDTGERGTQRHVHAGLQPVREGCAHGGEGFGQKHERRDRDADDGRRRPTASTAASIAGESTFARPTTATSDTNRSAKLVQAWRSVGGAAWALSSWAASGGRK